MIGKFKATISCFILTGLFSIAHGARATSLWTIATQATTKDPTYLNLAQTNDSTIANVGVVRANLLPSISLEATHTKTNNSYSGSSDYHGDTDSIQASLTQNILNLAYNFQLSSAKVTAMAARASTLSGWQEMLATVANDYISVANQQEILSIDRQQIAVERELLHLSQKMYNAGSGLLSDIATANASMLNEMAKKTTDQSTLTTYLATLATHTGNTINKVGIIDGVIPAGSPKEKGLQEWLSFATNNNPSIIEKKLDIVAAEKTLSADRAQFLPTLSGSYSYNKSKTNSELFSQFAPRAANSIGHSLVFSLDMPIMTGGSRFAQEKVDRHAYYAAKEALSLVRRTTRMNLRAYYASMRLGAKSIRQLSKAENAAKKAFDIMLIAYKGGKETMVDVQNSKDRWISAKLNFLSSEYTFLQTYILFKQTAGVISLHDMKVLSNWMSGNV